MSEPREALAEALFDAAFPGEREKDPYWYQAYEHDWYAQADRLLDSDALARLLADAEQRGAARVTAAVEAGRDAYLDSPGLDRAWVAGWHSATDHHAAKARAALTARPAPLKTERRGYW